MGQSTLRPNGNRQRTARTENSRQYRVEGFRRSEFPRHEKRPLLERSRDEPQPLYGSVDGWNGGAPTLLGGGLGQTPPAGNLAETVGPTQGAFRYERHDPANAQLGSFLHHEVHFIALGERLSEHDIALRRP